MVAGCRAAEATGIEVVSSVDLDDQDSRWLSKSVFGSVFSFMSEKVVWWGSAYNTTIVVNAARVPSLALPSCSFTPHYATLVRT
jgi:hypothetical protein